MADHHPMSPSKWPTWMLCPSFLPSDTTSDEAAEGTSAHAALAALLTGRQPEGEVPSQVFWAADQVFNDSNGSPLFVEKAVAYSNEDVSFAGTPDVFFFNDNNELVVYDFKTFADGTFDYYPQLMGCAIAIASTWPIVKKNKPIHLKILAGGVFQVFERTVSFRDCEIMAKSVFYRVAYSTRFPPVANPHCKYCARCASCTNAIEVIDDMNEPNLKTIENTLSALSGDRIVELLEQCTIAEGIVKRLRDSLKAEVIKRGEVASNGVIYSMKTENGAATLSDAQGLFDNLTANGVSVDSIIKSVKIGLPAAAKLLRSVDFTIKNDKDARAKLSPFFTIPTVSKLKKTVG